MNALQNKLHWSIYIGVRIYFITSKYPDYSILLHEKSKIKLLCDAPFHVFLLSFEIYKILQTSWTRLYKQSFGHHYHVYKILKNEYLPSSN